MTEPNISTEAQLLARLAVKREEQTRRLLGMEAELRPDLPPIVPSRGPRPEPIGESVGGGWHSVEIEDGAKLLFGDLGDG